MLQTALRYDPESKLCKRWLYKGFFRGLPIKGVTKGDVGSIDYGSYVGVITGCRGGAQELNSTSSRGLSSLG